MLLKGRGRAKATGQVEGLAREAYMGVSLVNL